MSSNAPINQLYIPIDTNPTQSINEYAKTLMSMPLPTYTPRATQTPVQSEQEEAQRIQDIMDGIAQRKTVTPTSEMQQRDGNIFINALREGREIGTGLTYLWSHAPELLLQGAENVYDFYKDKPIGQAIYDTIDKAAQIPQGLTNAVLAPYNVQLEDIGNRSARDIAGGVIEGMVHNPLSTLLDATSLGLLGAGTRALRNVPVLGRLAKADDVERAIATEGITVAEDINKLSNRLTKIKQMDTGKNSPLLQEAIEAAETGKTVRAEVKPILTELRAFSNEYNDIVKKYSPETYRGLEETAVVQKILRDRLRVNPQMSFEQVRREVIPLIESGEDIKKLAREGNSLAKEVSGAQALFKKGRIFPVTHGLANVDKTTSTVVEGISGLADAERAGRYSNRLWGTSSYEDIAKQLRDPDNFIKGIADSYLDKQISASILRGELGGLDLAIPADRTKNVMFVDRGLLEKGRASQALRSMRDKRMLETDVAIDADIAKELEKQINSSTSTYSGFARELYQVGKSTMLAQGTYLGANAITGATQAIINSGAGIVQDFIDALRSQGNLSKQLGVYRRSGEPLYSRNLLAKGIQKTNYVLGGKALSKADKWMQNKFAEIAAHAELRKMGIPYAQRTEALAQLDKQSLGQMIVDMKRAALINSTNTGIVPRGLTEVLGAVNPFYRWNITASQATARMLEKSPLLANTVLVDVLANIGFDKEMQNRLKLGVTLDKPYVSFRMDAKGNMRQMNAEFVPMTTSIKTFDVFNGNFIGNTVPVIGTLVNASKGLDRYGKPMKRAVSPDGIITQTVGTRRMQYDPRTGRFDNVGGQADEMINALITSVLGAPNLYNRTVAPLLSPIFGQGGQFYQPYGQSVFGSFDRNERDNNFIVGGNTLRPRTAQDVINILSGVYDTPYYESFDRISPNQRRQFFRGYRREQQRRFYGE